MSFLTIPVTDIRERIRAVLDSLDKPVFVTQHGRVRAVLMPIDAYNSLWTTRRLLKSIITEGETEGETNEALSYTNAI